MPIEEGICVTKESVKAMIGILNQTIDILHTKGSKVILTDKEYNMIDDAKKELETYKEVDEMMRKKGHITLCLMTSAIKKKGKVKIYTERDEDEDVDITEVSEPRRESNEPETMGYF